jgi:hypothetical protein
MPNVFIPLSNRYTLILKNISPYFVLQQIFVLSFFLSLFIYFLSSFALCLIPSIYVGM